MHEDLPLHDAIERASEHLGLELRLIDRYDLGAEGAYRMTVGSKPCAFKYWSGRRAAVVRLTTAVAAHATLRQVGWPLPAIYGWHQEPRFAFIVEQHMHGHRVDAVPEVLCRQLLALLDAAPQRIDGSIHESAAWVSALEEALYRDGAFPGRLLDLEQDTLGRRVIAAARTAFADARPGLDAGRQVLHGDFSAGNILCDEAGAVTAVVDWQHGGMGHRGFDLIGLEWDLALRLNVGAGPSLVLTTARVNEVVEPAVRTFFRAYYGVWNLCWALNTPDVEQVRHAVEVLDVL